MKRYLAVFAVTLSLSGCASIVESTIGLPSGTLTRSVDQPITTQMSAQIQQSLRLAVAGLRAHKRLCEAGTLPVSCVNDVARLQGYVRQARPVIVELRKFVRNNDQVNARVAFNTVVSLIAALQEDAARAGVKVEK